MFFETTINNINKASDAARTLSSHLKTASPAGAVSHDATATPAVLASNAKVAGSNLDLEQAIIECLKNNSNISQLLGQQIIKQVKGAGQLQFTRST